MRTKLHTPGRVRLDDLLVARGHFSTRSRAKDAVARGAIAIAGVAAVKPGMSVSQEAVIDVSDPAAAYVSRAALKLVAGLDAFQFDPIGRVALDIGASTGGFTQVLIERGAVKVFCVDVGHDQLHAGLRADPRVVSMEGLNARDLRADHLQGVAPQLVVSDVSFISLKLALPPALGVCAPGARGVFLVKPQFEAGRAAIGKGGMLRDPREADRVAEALHQWLDSQAGWRSLGTVNSPITGGDGNQEFLLGGVKDR